MPFMSLILATVGRTAELDRLFDTLAAQDFKDFEVIVVDQNQDNRLDAHVARARSLGIQLSHLRHFPANLAAARNVGIAASCGTWVGFPDDDCWYEPSLLQTLAARANGPDAPEGVIIRWVEQGEPPVTAPSLSWHRSASFRDVPVSSITLFMQRKLFDRVGGFDARLGVGQWFGAAEETDLVLRALREGAVIACEPAARVHHAVASDRPVHTPQTMLAARCRARGTGALYAKHELSPWVIVRGLVAPVLRPVLKGAFGADLAHGCAVMLGRLDGWRDWSRRHR
ncbi:MAG: glycosyltransferase family 2 protein [Herminiimonas sp.]|nr:glycosyltransferase family 2 protein [Herminiimonas sp.]